MLLRSGIAHAGVVELDRGLAGVGKQGGALLIQPAPGALHRQAVPLPEQHARRANDLEPDWTEAWLPGERVGRLIVNAEARLLWASASARIFLAPDMPLALRFGCLVAIGQFNQERLEALLRDSAVGNGRIDALFATSDAEPITVAIQARKVPGAGKTIAIQLRDLGTDLEADLPDLVRLYGLTKMEHRIVCLLLNGLSVGDIAARLNKSILTVRTHLKRTYSKLGISTKEQLFSRILRLV